MEQALSERGGLARLAIGLICAFVLLAGWSLLKAQDEAAANNRQPTAIVLKLDGAIGPASASYIRDGLVQAREEGGDLVIIEMDTPGGLDTSMREIIQDMLAMPIPVVTYVYPSGGRAASAGTFISYASHIAAMTPGTNLGAATPIQLVGAPAAPEGEEGEPQPANASERKAVNDAVAYIRSLAEMRGRNADWAEDAVRIAASLSAEAALKSNVIDIVAADRADLIRQLDGRLVEMNGGLVALETTDLAIAEVEPDWADQILAVISNPNVALILMMVGVYGLIFEFMNPGALVPGTIGGVSLLIGLYALAALPVDYAGAALIILGLALMVAEAFAPSFGILGIGGLVSFAVGAAILIDTDVPEFQVDWSVIAALGVAGFAVVVVAARLGIKSHRQKVQTGVQDLIGATAEILDWKDGRGHVYVRSERWNATGPADLVPGLHVVVREIDGLELGVTKEEGPDS